MAEKKSEVSLESKLVTCYPPSVVSKLKELVMKNYPPQGDWLTVSQIADQINRNPQWVRAILEKYFPDAGEVRLMSYNNRPRPHYPPSIVNKVRKLL